MTRKRHKPEEIVAKLRQVDVLLGQGTTVAEAVKTIKEATVRRYYYENHDRLRAHLATFVDAYNFARRLKTLNGLTPYEFICQIWTK